MQLYAILEKGLLFFFFSSYSTTLAIGLCPVLQLSHIKTNTPHGQKLIWNLFSNILQFFLAMVELYVTLDACLSA